MYGFANIQPASICLRAFSLPIFPSEVPNSVFIKVSWDDFAMGRPPVMTDISQACEIFAPLFHLQLLSQSGAHGLPSNN